MRAVVFDFDGTLSKEDYNVWKLLWQKCGSDGVQKRKQLYEDHRIKKIISRQEWFDLTAQEFRNNSINFKDFYEISSKIELLPGVKEVILKLYEEGYDLYIVSGCLKESITLALGPYTKYFKDIQANSVNFEEGGLIKNFNPTKYDFEGKAVYIEMLKANGYDASDIVFIGNSGNDEWVHLTGCKTICINPVQTDFKNREKWDRVFVNVTDLRQLFVRVDYRVQNEVKRELEK